MSLVSVQGSHKFLIIPKQYCTRCGLYRDHMLLRRWTERGSDSDTYVKAEAWICSYCDSTWEKRSQETRPTEEISIIRRLIKLSGDYEQIRHSTLEVRGDTVTLKLKLLPWVVVQAAKRVEEAKRRGFFRLGDLWRLQQHGLLKEELEDRHRHAISWRTGIQRFRAPPCVTGGD